MSEDTSINVIETQPREERAKIIDIFTRKPWQPPETVKLDEEPEIEPDRQTIRALKDALALAREGKVGGLAMILYSQEAGWGTWVTDTMTQPDLSTTAIGELAALQDFMLMAKAVGGNPNNLIEEGLEE